MNIFRASRGTALGSSTAARFLIQVIAGLLLAQAAAASAQVAVLTYHNDLARLGLNTNETQLTLANVNTNTFGLLGTYPVDDWIYAQPLVMTNVNLPGKGTHNLVLIATVNDSVYAFDADDPTSLTPYWQTSFLGPGVVAVRNTDMTGACGGNYQDFHGNMGIVGTPVIDPTRGTLYVVAKTKENGSTFVQRLHALDVATGSERAGSPVVIAATYPGTGDGSSGGIIPFDAMKENQRPALALVNGVVYIGWASHCDWGPYHGWLIGYEAQSLAQVSTFNTTPNGGLGGIWSSGGAPAVDSAGNLYFETGNGTFSPASGNYGDSFLKVATTNGLALADYFTPYNQAALSSADLDIGSGGCVALPDSAGSSVHPHLLVGGSKAGKLYLLDRDNLGQFNATSDAQIVQAVTNATGQCYDTPVYFNHRLYLAGTGDHLKSFNLSNAVINITPTSQSPGTFGFSAPTPSLTANGDSQAIVWALQVEGWGSGQPAILHAYNATNLALELYNSSQAGSRDQAAGAVKFSVPTVANGKVYVGGQYALSVYGSAAGFVATPVIAPSGGLFTNSTSVAITCATPGAAIYYTLDNSAPTLTSRLYTSPLILSNSAAVRARAFKSGYGASGVASATFLNQSAIGQGTGLLAEYFSNHLPAAPFTGAASLVRTDAVVNFNWGSGSPDASITADHFTTRWTGSVQPQFSEPYTFYTSTDDGVRLWVNNQLVVDHWVDQGTTEWSGTLPLIAGQRYNLEMDYYENAGSAVAGLSWSSPSTTKTIIPTTQLYPTPNQPPTVSLDIPRNGDTYIAPAPVSLSATAIDADDTIRQVDFYANGTWLGSVSNPPFALTVTGLAAAPYTLTAVATDGAGYAATSAPVNITISTGSGNPYGFSARPAAPAYFNFPTNASGNLPPTLSQAGLFSSTTNLIPVAALVPYALNQPFWWDNASQSRWFSIPGQSPPYTPDRQIAFSPTGEWTFPAGSVFVQHLELATDETQPNARRRLETRVLVCDAGGSAYGVSFKWRADQSDADLLTDALNENLVITNASGIRTQTWSYPSPATCAECHQEAAHYVLGLNTRQLNSGYTYPATGISDNQLRTLNQAGYFYPAFSETNLPAYARLAALTNQSAPIEDRARSYLDANCAQCHRPGGTGTTFDARYDTPLTNQNLINALLQKGDLGIDHARVVVPQDIWRSILYQRMNTMDMEIRMPDMGGNLVQTAAVQVVTDWINSLPGTPALAPPQLTPAGGTFVASVHVTLTASDTNAVLRYTLDNSPPTTNSLLYVGPFVLTNSAVVSARAFEPQFNDSIVASGTFTIRSPIFFSLPGSFSNGGFQIPFSGLVSRAYVFQASSNLSNWISLSTNLAPANTFNLVDPGASNYHYRFYRAFELP